MFDPRSGEVYRAATDHWNLVHCISRHACGSDDAPDVAQEVFLRYSSNAEQFDGDRGSSDRSAQH
jgi:DNA-directed RNA polymerase specialized sigma24 family protein